MEDLGLDARAADVIVGTSAGALVAASLRRYPPARPQPAAQARDGLASRNAVDRRGPRIDLPIRLRFQQFLRGETWRLRRHGLRIVTIEPDTATLQGPPETGQPNQRHDLINPSPIAYPAVLARKIRSLARSAGCLATS